MCSYLTEGQILKYWARKQTGLMRGINFSLVSILLKTWMSLEYRHILTLKTSETDSEKWHNTDILHYIIVHMNSPINLRGSPNINFFGPISANLYPPLVLYYSPFYPPSRPYILITGSSSFLQIETSCKRKEWIQTMGTTPWITYQISDV